MTGRPVPELVFAESKEEPDLLQPFERALKLAAARR